MPKTLKHLAELYDLLREMVNIRSGYIVLEGFSVYEVDGVFRGKKGKIWEERTLVIRLLLPFSPDEANDHRITDIGLEIAAKVAPHEEQIWITSYAMNVTAFWPSK
jgi:triacylglycerol esterase/lipase EstA (alpha/beta hydrolase family)